MNINNAANVIIDYTISFFNRLDLLMLTKVNKRFNKYKSDPKSKNIKFLINGLSGDIMGQYTACTNAAIEGYLDILIYLRECKCEWNENTCAAASSGGHLEVLKWARENGCDWDFWTSVCAAENGHLEVLKWARANDCEWNARICEFAATNGHLEVLKWAKKNLGAVIGINGHVYLLQWLDIWKY
jgi:hypothetical protein